MARTALTVTNAYGTIDPAKVAATLNAGDATNDHKWSIQENDIIVVYNAGASAVEVVLKGAPDLQNRTADSTQSIAASGMYIWGPLKRDAWEQTGGEGWIDVDTDTDPKIVVLRVSGKV